MSIYEPARALWWIDHKLNTVVVTAGAAGIWPKAAPETVAPDQVVVLYNMQASLDVENASALRLWTNGLYLIKVVGPASKYDTIVAVYDAIDTALQLQGDETTGPNNDCYLMRCDREQPLALPIPPAVNGELQEAIGALWRIHIRSLVG